VAGLQKDKAAAANDAACAALNPTQRHQAREIAGEVVRAAVPGLIQAAVQKHVPTMVQEVGGRRGGGIFLLRCRRWVGGHSCAQSVCRRKIVQLAAHALELSACTDAAHALELSACTDAAHALELSACTDAAPVLFLHPCRPWTCALRS